MTTPPRNLRRFALFLTLLLTLLVVSQNAYSQEASTKDVEQLLRRYADYEQLNGAILVARNGKVLYQGAFGLANKELRVRNTLRTRFAIASITKTFTALLTFRLIERGKLKLDAHIADYLPDYPAPNGKTITIQQLLQHTAGLQRDIADFPLSGHNFPDQVAKINADFYSLEEMVPLIAARPLVSEPGAEYHYSSDGYLLLGAIIARVSGKPYEAVLQDEILTPLGMMDTYYVPQTSLLPERATGYSQTFGGYDNARLVGISPAGGITMTIGDLFKLDRALSGDTFLSAETKARLWKPSAYIPSYGWKVLPDTVGMPSGVFKVQASGSLPGFNSLYTRTLSDNLCVILLTNTHDMRFRLDEITDNTLAILRGKPITELRRSAAQEVAQILRTQGLKPALDQYKAWRKAGFPQLERSESELNSLGYYLLERRQFPEAIAILKLNTEDFPMSGNAFDSLGEAYLLSGDRAQAITNYEKSLQLDPKNTNAVSVLKRLREEN